MCVYMHALTHRHTLKNKSFFLINVYLFPVLVCLFVCFSGGSDTASVTPLEKTDFPSPGRKTDSPALNLSPSS